MRALQHASSLACWYESALTTLYVDAAPPIDNADDLRGFSIAPTAVLESARPTPAVDDLPRFVARALSGRQVDIEVEHARDVADVIVRRAATSAADVIVMGTHGRTGVKRWFTGSVAERVLRTAPCPVMVVPPGDAVPPATVSFKHIVAAVDFSESSLAALRWAVSLAEESDAHLWLLHTIEVPPELRVSTVLNDEEIDQLNASARADVLNRLRALIPQQAAHYCSIETATATGEAAHALLRFAAEHNADLIVMGAQDHGALDRVIFGSKTQGVIAGATCPVLTVRR